MNTFFEAKVKYEAIDEQTGKQKKVNLPYLVDAVSYTEAESRIHKEMEQYVSGEFSVDSIKKVKYTDLFLFDDGDKYYECTIKFVSIDEEAGREKKVINKVLVLASDLDEAKKRMDESMQGMTVDYDITSVKETKIADVFIYEAEDKGEQAYMTTPVKEWTDEIYKLATDRLGEIFGSNTEEDNVLCTKIAEYEDIHVKMPDVSDKDMKQFIKEQGCPDNLRD